MQFNNNKSALENSEFVNEAISELLDNGCIHAVPFQPFVVNPLSVAIQSSGKKRLILNLSELNVCYKKKINSKIGKLLSSIFSKDCYFFKLDLKFGYFHLDICVEQQTFLGFYWNTHFYCFSVLVFGLSSVPHIFTKCLRPMVKYWRQNGVNIVLYLDDGLGMTEGYSECQNMSDFVKSSLEQAGFFLINEQKSNFDPVQCLEWLGLIWDSKGFTLSIPERRINGARESFENILKLFPDISTRKLAQITGRIISMSPVMGNITNLISRHLYFAIENRISWDGRFQMAHTECVMVELKFWSENLINLIRSDY
jgi:hypothetical protein